MTQRRIVRSDDCAELSFSDIREASILGIAIAAIIPMIATTISNSISEKPLSLDLVIWTTYKKRDGVSPIPFTTDCIKTSFQVQSEGHKQHDRPPARLPLHLS